MPTPPSLVRSDSGFSLVEVLVAAGLVASALAGAAQLLATAVRDNTTSRDRTYATVLAAQKAEQLRTDDYAGLQVPDVDYVDRFGRVLASGGAPPPGSIYVRRWSAAPLAGDPSTIAIDVRVVRATAPAGADRHPDEARIFTVRMAP